MQWCKMDNISVWTVLEQKAHEVAWDGNTQVKYIDLKFVGYKSLCDVPPLVKNYVTQYLSLHVRTYDLYLTEETSETRLVSVDK